MQRQKKTKIRSRAVLSAAVFSLTSQTCSSHDIMIHPLSSSSLTKSGESISVNGDLNPATIPSLESSSSVTRDSANIDFQNDEAFLKDFYESTHGENWTVAENWLDSNSNFCSWHGISCTSLSSFVANGINERNSTQSYAEYEIGRVQSINLSNNNLSGSINLLRIIFKLPYLTELRLDGNPVYLDGSRAMDGSRKILTGTNTTKQTDGGKTYESSLHYIDLSHTRLINLKSLLEDAYSGMSLLFPKLTDLRLLQCGLSGVIPSSFASVMPSMRRLSMDHNDLSGNLPASFAIMEQLHYLGLSDNDFTGNLPSEWTTMKHLRYIELNHNQLAGPLPLDWHLDDYISLATGKALGNIANSLERLDLSHQRGLNENNDRGLTGPIPSFSGAKSLRRLDLSSNSFSGPLSQKFLYGIDPEMFEVAVLESNQISGVFELLDDSPLLLQKGGDQEIELGPLNGSIRLGNNRISDVETSLCPQPMNQGGMVAVDECDVVLCHPGTYSAFTGRANLPSYPCTACQGNYTNAIYWGSFSCNHEEENDIATVSADLSTSSLSEKDALLYIFDVCTGEKWTHNDGWIDNDTDSMHCTWYGIKCDDKGRVLSLQLESNNLEGRIEITKIAQLKALRSIDLSHNNIIFDFGIITSDDTMRIESMNLAFITRIDNLHSISYLNKTLGELHLDDSRVLQTWNASSNLSGNGSNNFALPVGMYELSNLRRLSMDRTHIAGKLLNHEITTSEGIESWKKLIYLSMVGNQISGTIPSGLSKLKSLSILRLRLNNLHGEGLEQLVTELTQITVLDISRQISEKVGVGGLTGKIPTFENMHKLKRLELRSNKLTGSIPSNFLKNVDAKSFMFADLSRNFLSGALPESFASLPGYIYIEDNRITDISAACDSSGLKQNSTNQNNLMQLVQMFGCDSLLCKPGTYNSFGRRESYDSPCKKCQITENLKYFGSIDCIAGNEGGGEVDSTQYTMRPTKFKNTNPFDPPSLSPMYQSLTISSLSQRESLISLYSSCGGRYWIDSTNWLRADAHICTWVGISCTSGIVGNSGVTGIVLRSNNLEGRIPLMDLLHNIPTLENLEIDGNSVVVDFSDFNNENVDNSKFSSSLKLLDVSQTIIHSLQGLDNAGKNLIELYISGNDLKGPFPKEILDLTSLERLAMNFNSFEGELPNLTIFPNLQYFSAHDNEFIGNIPLLPNSIEIINVHSNSLSGPISLSFPENDSLSKLLYVNLSHQKTFGGSGFTGPLPSFSYYYNIKRLDLSSNSFSSDLPIDMLSHVNTSHFEFLDLSDNLLTGIVPSSWETLDVFKFDLSNNLISMVSNELCVPAPVDIKHDIGTGVIHNVDCSSVLCPPFTYNKIGRDLMNRPCLACPNQYPIRYGATTCNQQKIATSSPTSLQKDSTHDKDEQLILETFFDQCGGKRWINNTNWLSVRGDASFRIKENNDVNTVCSWFGVTCDSGGSVTALELGSNNVVGTVPSQLFDLAHLETLDLRHNKLNLNMMNISKSKSLLSINLSFTEISSLRGIGAAGNLKTLIMSHNDIRYLPEEVFNLIKLERLDLTNNRLQGSLPVKIGKLSNLRFLSLQSNGLTGSIPEPLSNLRNLVMLKMGLNSFLGTLPDKLFNAMYDLAILDLSHQGDIFKNPSSCLTGPLPVLQDQHNLRRVDLSYNAFSAHLPEHFLEAGNVELLEIVDLRFNMLSGEIPMSLSRFGGSDGSVLFLQENYITSVQVFCDERKKWDTLINDFGCSAFLCPPGFFHTLGHRDESSKCESCVTAEYWGTTQCFSLNDEEFEDGANSLKEGHNEELSEREILTLLYQKCDGYFWTDDAKWLENDTNICNWTGIECTNDGNVRSINLSANNLKGSPPSEIFLLPFLETLSLYSNPLGDFDFSQIHLAANLKTILLDSTGLKSIHGIKNAPNLHTLNLRFNQLSGDFPSDILQLKKLEHLSLSHNMISFLPSNMGTLISLQSFLFSSNDAKGDLSRLLLPSSLRILDLSNNLIAGTIPNNFLSYVPQNSKMEINLSGNMLSGVVPSQLSRFQHMTILLSKNQLSTMGDELCHMKEWNYGDVGRYGCDAILCPIGRYTQKGRHSSFGKCVACKSAEFLGSTSCEDKGDYAWIQKFFLVSVISSIAVFFIYKVLKILRGRDEVQLNSHENYRQDISLV